MRNLKTTTALSTVLLLALTACGGDDEEIDERQQRLDADAELETSQDDEEETDEGEDEEDSDEPIEEEEALRAYVEEWVADNGADMEILSEREDLEDGQMVETFGVEMPRGDEQQTLTRANIYIADSSGATPEREDSEPLAFAILEDRDELGLHELEDVRIGNDPGGFAEGGQTFTVGNYEASLDDEADQEDADATVAAMEEQGAAEVAEYLMGEGYAVSADDVTVEHENRETISGNPFKLAFTFTVETPLPVDRLDAPMLQNDVVIHLREFIADSDDIDAEHLDDMGDLTVNIDAE